MKRVQWVVLLAGVMFAAVASAEDDNLVGLGVATSPPNVNINGSGPINFYGQLHSAISAGDSNIDIIAASVKNSSTSFAFAPGGGELILFWQPTFAGAATSGDQTPLTLGSATSQGIWEFAEATSSSTTTGVTTVHVSRPMNNSFSLATAQVVVVPQYQDLTINANKNVTADPWDSSTHTGGIVALVAKGTVTLSNGATITADAAGSPGGQFLGTGAACPVGPPDTDLDLSSPAGTGSKKGRGVVETVGQSTGAGNVANAGGGGNCDLGGGGGGGNLGFGGQGGDGAAGFGGKGGVGVVIAANDPDQFHRLVMGGGGGAGQGGTAAGAAGTDGGRGGGVIFIRANRLVTNSGAGAISANGGDANAATTDGAGGGGAGGSIYVRLVADATCTASETLSATGGAGGDSDNAAAGAGGGGGGGRIFFQAASMSVNCHTDPSPGQNGHVPVGGAPNAAAGLAGTLFPTPPAGGYCTSTFSAACIGGNVCDDARASGVVTNACVACVADGNCSSATTARCNLLTLACITCTDPGGASASDAHCTHLSSGNIPACLGGTCHQCSSTNSGQCTASQVCSDESSPGGLTFGDCVDCNGDTDCSTTSSPRCNAHNCSTCTDVDQPTGNGHCTRFTTTPGCGPTGHCVQCATGATGQCTGGTPQCHTNPGLCVQCLNATQCTAAAPVCDISGGSPTFSCIGCTDTAANTECTSYSSTPACKAGAPNQGSCVQCSTSEHSKCISSTPNCDVGAGSCAECENQTNSECLTVAKPQCNSNDTCDVCTSNNGCTGHGILTHCDSPGSGQCFECLDNTHCSTATKPECSGSHVCQACTPTGDGSAAAGCVGHSGAFCESSSGKCVQCLKNADCTNPNAPSCDTNPAHGSFHTCITCTAVGGDNGCIGHAGTLACQPGGTCGQCSLTNTTACDATATPACNFQSGGCQLCTVNGGGTDMGANSSACASIAAGHQCESGSSNTVFCGCTADSDCGSPSSGRICDPLVHTCTNGCSRAVSRNNCPMGQFCTAALDGSNTGVCTLQCNFDVDCTVGGMTTSPFCIGTDADGGLGHCVQCRNGGDCTTAGALVCDPQNNNCVECTQAQSSACSTNGTGAICLTNDQCGCAVDSDCGGSASGRVCDDVMHVCAAGCRGSGGNGCPTTLMCTSATSTIGTCVEIPDMSTIPDMAVAVDMAAPGPEDMSVGDMRGLDASVRLDAAPMPSTQSLSGGGFGCAYAGAPRAGASVPFFLLLVLALGLGRRGNYRREDRP